jgi:hypothetical protein
MGVAPGWTPGKDYVSDKHRLAFWLHLQFWDIGRKAQKCGYVKTSTSKKKLYENQPIVWEHCKREYFGVLKDPN